MTQEEQEQQQMQQQYQDAIQNMNEE